MLRFVFIFVFVLSSSLSVLSQNELEHFKFELRFGILKGGEAHYFLKDTIIENKAVYLSSLHGYTIGVTNLLYAVDDKFESILEPENYFPSVSYKKLKEQNYRFSNEVKFDHQNGLAISQNSGKYLVEEGICDISALMQKVRFSDDLNNHNLKEIIEIPFWDTDEWYYLKLKFTAIETIRTQLGEFECLRLEPLEIAGRFFNKRNPMNIWISNDEFKLPVLMELNFSIGSVKCELTEAKQSSKLAFTNSPIN